MRKFKVTPEFLFFCRLMAISFALFLLYCSLASCKEVTVKDENGTISRCLVFQKAKKDSTFHGGKNHSFTIISTK